MAGRYSHLAKIYPHIMKQINYKDWAKYIYMIYDILDCDDDRVLELACGQCSVSRYLKDKFPKIISTDLSFDMLKECDIKNIRKICCNMLQLPFKEKFAYIFATFDSVNYLLTEEQLLILFESVSDVLVEGGYFTFDVSLERNSLKNQKLLNRSGTYKGIKYIQKSNFDKKRKIHYNKFKFIYENGDIFEEIHEQKIYEFEDYFRILEDTDFNVYACYDSFSFDDVSSKTYRAQFVLKKRDNLC